MADSADARLAVAARCRGHAKLNSAREEIRLIRVTGLPCETGAAITLGMMTVSLQDDWEYDALSYAWGDLRPTHVANVDGLGLPITQNLYDALCVLGRPGVLSKPLWIDALCIQQDDLEERSQQVAMMGKIYRRATNVRVWLGLPGPYTATALETLHVNTLSNLVQLWPQNDELARGIDDLMQRSWWHRLWVLQEVGDGKTAVAHCGELTIKWLQLARFASSLLVARLRFAEYQERRFRSLGLRALASTHDRKVWDYYHLKSYGTPFSPVETFRLCATFYCSDHRDKVYGLLNLLPTGFRMRADYTLPLAKIYEQATAEAIRVEENLSILSMAGLYTSKSSHLASWVPDLSNIYPLEDREMVSEVLQPCAFAGAMFSSTALGYGRLQVRGLVLDSCRIRCDAQEAFATAAAEHRPQESILTRCRCILRYWRSMAIAMCTNQTIAVTVQQFWRVALDDVHTFDETHRTALCEGWLDGDDETTTFAALGLLESQLIEWCERVAFFVTVSGKLGFAARPSVAAGDALAILAGSRRPVFIKPGEFHGSTGYRLVTTCRCDGIMWGEAVRGPAVYLEGLLRQGLSMDEIDFDACKGHLARPRQSMEIFVMVMAETHELRARLKTCRQVEFPACDSNECDVNASNYRQSDPSTLDTRLALCSNIRTQFLAALSDNVKMAEVLDRLPSTLENLDVPGDELAESILSPFTLWQAQDTFASPRYMEDITEPLYGRTACCILAAHIAIDVLASQGKDTDNPASLVDSLHLDSGAATWMMHAVTAPQRKVRLREMADLLFEDMILI